MRQWWSTACSLNLLIIYCSAPSLYVHPVSHHLFFNNNLIPLHIHTLTFTTPHLPHYHYLASSAPFSPLRFPSHYHHHHSPILTSTPTPQLSYYHNLFLLPKPLLILASLLTPPPTHLIPLPTVVNISFVQLQVPFHIRPITTATPHLPHYYCHSRFAPLLLLPLHIRPITTTTTPHLPHYYYHSTFAPLLLLLFFCPLPLPPHYIHDIQMRLTSFLSYCPFANFVCSFVTLFLFSIFRYSDFIVRSFYPC